MRLEDALLYVVVDEDTAASPGLGGMCERAIAGGVDIIRLALPDAGPACEVREACRRGDALFLMSDDAELAASVEAGGVHFSSPNAPVGIARAVMGMDAILGLGARTPDELRLAVEVGADYVVSDGGRASPGWFATIGGGPGVPLFAGGIEGRDDAAAVIDGGVYRLCIGAKLLLDGDVTENAAAYSTLLGRCM